jgi:hypothetical protein
MLVTGSRSDGREEMGGGAHRGLGFPARSPETRPEADAGDVVGVPGGYEVDDDVPCDKRNPMVTTAASIFSRGGSRGRLEMCGAAMSFGLHCRDRFPTKWFSPWASRGAPE